LWCIHVFPQEQRQLCKTEKLQLHNDLRVLTCGGRQRAVPLWNMPTDEIGTSTVFALELKRTAELERKRRGVLFRDLGVFFSERGGTKWDRAFVPERPGISTPLS
jgi:hypothetical protein